MTVDPVDDCTFWFTSEYLTQSGTFNWHTRIGTFTLPGCGKPDFGLSATPSSQTVSPGNPASYTVNVTPTGGFTGAVDLAVSGLPAGATGTFAPNPTTGASTLTVGTAAATPTGNYPLTITGTSGTLVHTTTVTLVVQAPAPDFTISASPAARSIARGTGTTYTVTVNRLNGFAGSVTMSVTGLPSRAAASFSPNPTTSTSTLTVTTKTRTPVGTFTLTIKGTSGSLAHTTTVTLQTT
jgi:hypothetical protein